MAAPRELPPHPQQAGPPPSCLSHLSGLHSLSAQQMLCVSSSACPRVDAEGVGLRTLPRSHDK